MNIVIKLLIILFSFDVAASECEKAEYIANIFLALEIDGKRSGAVKEYRNIMNYTLKDGSQGDEPGWDSVNLVESYDIPEITGCRNMGKNGTVLQIAYRTIGIVDGWTPKPNICMYKHLTIITEQMTIKDGKVYGIKIHKPYIYLNIAKLANTNKISACSQR